jgi:hypothetical protein
MELAGCSRPRSVALSKVCDILPISVISRDHPGVALKLLQESYWRQREASGFRSRKDRR